MAAEKIILYGFYKSSSSWRLRIALALKGLEHKKVSLSLVKGEHLTDEFKALNPMRQLPTLFIDGMHLSQSIPIMEYLEERNPSPPLLPRDKVARAKVRALSEVVNSGIQPYQTVGVIKKVQETHKDWGHFYVSRGLEALNSLMQETAGRYSYGDQVTMADACLVPQVFSALTRFSVDVTQYPVVSRVYEELNKLPEFKVADARRQPDTPDAERID
ncbi:maleylacetoacetate isomerase isoform X1 [Aplysia californica]|uniref:maleylacetoacetate isomerase n=1 Tax=Aplysia californica TaxID=6500 RepID=A0ABM0K234_APLCA|nr:maleylacetoacetate isomerase isoform X1 [Aplysia californica]